MSHRADGRVEHDDASPVVPCQAPRPWTASPLVRIGAATVVTTVLVGAVWVQRETVGSAISEMRRMSLVALAVLLALTAYERLSRARIVRRLLGAPVGTARALTIHDVGNAASKGVPFGGALGTALRWSISRDSGVCSTRFASMLIGYGAATMLVTWMLPLIALLVDLTQRPANSTDIALIATIASVIAVLVTGWTLVLRSDRLESWASGTASRLTTRLARRITALDGRSAGSSVAEVRGELRGLARRPWALVVQTALAQACGAVILLVALRSLGVGDELTTSEFFRVFFLTHLAGTFAPTPGGVGVVEAGLTGALIAAGVDTSTALAGVIVYRSATYVVPIAFGAVLYVAWRVRGVRSRSATLQAHGAPIDAAIPDVPRVAYQGVRGL